MRHAKCRSCLPRCIGEHSDISEPVRLKTAPTGPDESRYIGTSREQVPTRRDSRFLIPDESGQARFIGGTEQAGSKPRGESVYLFLEFTTDAYNPSTL